MGTNDADIENPRETDAQAYLDKHRILDMFDNMTSMLIHARPDEPKVYLIQQLEKLRIAKQSGMYYPCLFDDSNLNSIFGMLDPTKLGYITREQFGAALSTIGITNFDEYPPGSEVNRITLDTFLREALGENELCITQKTRLSHIFCDIQAIKEKRIDCRIIYCDDNQS